VCALSVRRLRARVRAAYGAAAAQPGGPHAFPVGRAFAEGVGYPPDLLDALPCAAVEAFTGAACLAGAARVPEGAVVLDLGCGAGLDSILAARSAGPRGRVLGVDFSPEMLARARRAAREAGAGGIGFLRADAEALPLRDGAADVALANGLLNLNPLRSEILREAARVLRPGGSLFLAELVLQGPLPPEESAGEESWFR